MQNVFQTRVRPGLFGGLLLLLLAVTPGCSKGGSQPGGAPNGTTPKDASILVGVYAPLTGSEAAYGQSMHNGMELALADRNATGGVGGRKVVSKVYDTQCKTQEAGTAVTRLITEDKVTALLGELTSTMSIAGGRVAQQYGVPMITPTATNPQVTQIGDMIFRVCFIDPYQGYVCARFLRDNLKLGKAAVLYDQTQAYSTGLREFFVKSFKEQGGAIASEQAYSGGDQDFTAQLTTIRDSKPEVVFIPGYYAEVGNIALQARKVGITVPLIGCDGWDSAKLTEIAGSAIEGCYYSNHYSPEDQRPEVRDFIRKYQEKFKAAPDSMAANGYDAAALLTDAMGRAPSLGGRDLAKAIGETKGFKGVTGSITIDPNRDAVKSAVILQLKGGKPVYVATINPAQ